MLIKGRRVGRVARRPVAVASEVFLPIWAPGLLLGGGPIYLRLGRWETFSGASEGGFVVYLSAGIGVSGWAQNSEIFEPVSAIVASSSFPSPPSLVLCLSVFCLFADVPGKGTLIRLLYIPPLPPLSLSLPVSYLGFFGCRADGRIDGSGQWVKHSSLSE